MPTSIESIDWLLKLMNQKSSKIMKVTEYVTEEIETTVWWKNRTKSFDEYADNAVSKSTKTYLIDFKVSIKRDKDVTSWRGITL